MGRGFLCPALLNNGCAAAWRPWLRSGQAVKGMLWKRDAPVVYAQRCANGRTVGGAEVDIISL